MQAFILVISCLGVWTKRYQFTPTEGSRCVRSSGYGISAEGIRVFPLAIFNAAVDGDARMEERPTLTIQFTYSTFSNSLSLLPRIFVSRARN